MARYGRQMAATRTDFGSVRETCLTPLNIRETATLFVFDSSHTSVAVSQLTVGRWVAANFSTKETPPPPP